MDFPRLRHVCRRVFLAYGWMSLVVVAGFQHSGRAGHAAEMMAERGSGADIDLDADDPPTRLDPSAHGSSSSDSPADETGDRGVSADTRVH